MLKVDNIIQLWKSWFLTWYQSHALNLAMSIESSNIEQKIVNLEDVVKSDSSVEQMVYFIRGLQRKKSNLD